MSKLITIAGFEKSYDDLLKADYKTGAYVNVLEGNPFKTYVKTGKLTVAELGLETDVVCWYATKEELEAAVPNPDDGAVYIIGEQAPYQRRKAVVRGIDVNWKDDGEYLYKVVKHFKSKFAFKRDTPEPKDGDYYSVGDTAPYLLYGMVSGWDEVGMYVSKSFNSINVMRANRNEPTFGEVYFCEGMFYLYCMNTAEGDPSYRLLPVHEPFQNYGKHVYTQNGKRYSLRESPQLGNYEWYSPKE